MNNHSYQNSLWTRRQCLSFWGNGIGSLAFIDMLRSASIAAPAVDRAPAKSMIYLYMDGGPSHLDTFDYKPRLVKDHGKIIDFGLPKRFDSNQIMQSPFKFRRHGKCGAWVSEVFPRLSSCVDEICFLHSMVAENMDHPTANMFMNTGSAIRGRPSLGSWLTYGLGRSSKDLPDYIVLFDNGFPQGGMEVFDQGFLSPKFKAMSIHSSGARSVANLRSTGSSTTIQQSMITEIDELNNLGSEQAGAIRAVEALKQSYELAFRMQTSVPELYDISKESNATKSLYGLDNKETETFGRQCLIARRLVERGVRFIVLLPPTKADANRWDHHDDLPTNLRVNARYIDKPIAGLMRDLSGRGLFDQTLLLWGGEFGRTPTGEFNSDIGPGREHNPHGFTMWLAGGGIKKGISYGATDDYGCHAVENKMTVHDLHVTILRQFGIDHTKLTFRHQGRDYRLTDVYGQVIDEIIAL